jgi:hypothetical protein
MMRWIVTGAESAGTLGFTYDDVGNRLSADRRNRRDRQYRPVQTG